MIQDDRLHKKELYLEYLTDVPIHKWASKAVMISEDTSKRWRDEDKDFADQCELKISAFVRRTAKRAKPEFQLERLLKNDFSQKIENEVTLPKPILDNISKDVPTDNSNKEGSSV